ncbi:hypothetical protein [Pendulispora albinea]|uniref:Secreted protein n=1 Tax=Pendulispora albinea TaxID=2741071 RepID=A0ABZ2LJQ4_9BACT
MAFSKSRFGTGISVVAVALGVMVLEAQAAKASPADTVPSADDFAAQGCELVRHKVYLGRHINTWRCDDFRMHGQISNARKGDSVWLAATPENKAYVPDGSTFANTASDVAVGDQSCGQVVGFPVDCN